MTQPLFSVLTPARFFPDNRSKRGRVMRVGIDFGTSNTSVAMFSGGEVRLIELEPGQVSIPTAIFYEADSRDRYIGAEANEVYEAGEDGRLLRSIKSVLGSDLIDETTQIGLRSVPFRQVISDFLQSLLERVRDQTGEAVTEVFQGRPVSFNDTDPALDARAQTILGDCLGQAGVKTVSFMPEPVAAAHSVAFGGDRERLVFVVDIGGGTSDFSLVRIEPAKGRFDVLSSSGVYIGGNDFDRLLSYFEITPLFGRTETLELNGLPAPATHYATLSDWKSLNKLYLPAVAREVDWMRKNSPNSVGIRAFEYLIQNYEAALYAHKTEAVKIALSDAPEAGFDYAIPQASLHKPVARDAFNLLIAESLSAMNQAAYGCLDAAGMSHEKVTDIMMVGGSTFVPAVEQNFLRQFPNAEITANDRFGAVARGLASLAATR